MMQIFKEPNYQFISRRYIGFIFSGLLTLITIVSLVAHKGLRYSVDFKGGTLLEVNFTSPIKTDELRTAFKNLAYGNVSIQQLSGGYDFIIRFETQGMLASTDSTSNQVMQMLQSQIPNNQAKLVRIEMVGPRVGKELQKNALISVLIGMVLILFYVAIRFDFRFGTAAVIALIHDVFSTIGFISITNTEFSVTIIAVLLTIIGFSVNNSIVIADRVRENKRKMLKDDLPAIINHSINQTLSRTVLTSFTVFMVAIILYFLGAASIKDFAKAMSFGILIGTYSSIFIGAPIVAEIEKWMPSRRRRK
jgi:preprotein translocase subunit SecF